VSQPYFRNMNYSLGNEDSSLEFNLLAPNASAVLTVAGSGSRFLPLLAKKPRKIICVDLSQEQLFVSQLRVESLRAFTREEYCAFWGYPPVSMSQEQRQRAFSTLGLSEKARSYFARLFQDNNWNSTLYSGNWEKTFKILSKVNRFITGKRAARLFECKTLEAQTEYLETQFPRKAWHLVLLILGNALVFDSLLYKGHFPKKNNGLSYLDFYSTAFDRLFRNTLARDNFFLQLAFFGQIKYPSGNTIECQPEIYAPAKNALQEVEVKYVNGDILDAANSLSEKVDFVSLSDVPSYLDDKAEKTFLQKLTPCLAKNALIVSRSYLKIPKHVDASGYEKLNDHYQDLIQSEKVGVYNIDIYRWRQSG